MIAVLAADPLPVTSGGSPFDQMTAALGSAFARIVGLLLTFWTSDADPSLLAGAAVGSRVAAQVREYSGPLTVTTATIGVVVAGTRMAITSSRAAEPARDLLRGLGVLTLVWWGGAFAVRIVGGAFDDAGRHVLASARVGAGSVEGLEDVLGSLAVTDPGLVFLLCLVGALSGLAQFLLLLVREPSLALLAGALPVAAGAAVGGVGSAALKRLAAWTLAVTAFPFVAALVYAAAFSVLGTARDLGAVVSGTILVTVAVAVLPALLRLINPAVAAATSGRRDHTDADSTLATGAVALGGRFRPGAGGPPSDAGPQTRPGLLAPSGSGPAALGSGRRPPGHADRAPLDPSPVHTPRTTADEPPAAPHSAREGG